MHAVWKGTISFGLVSVPVKLYTATGSKAVSFKYLHRACGTPIQYVKRCPSCNVDVAPDEIAKGYAYPDGRFVLVEEEDVQDLPGAAPRTLELAYFVPRDELDPLHFNKSYYLEPGEGGGRAYSLLHQVMEAQQVMGLCRFALRSKESLAAIRPGQPLLVLHTLYFPDEVRTNATLQAPPLGAVRPAEVQMAQALVQTLTGPYDAEALAPRQREALLERIALKASTQAAVVPAGQPKGDVVDLLAALRASVERTRAVGEGATGAAPTADVPAAPTAEDPVPPPPPPQAAAPPPQAAAPPPQAAAPPVPGVLRPTLGVLQPARGVPTGAGQTAAPGVLSVGYRPAPPAAAAPMAPLPAPPLTPAGVQPPAGTAPAVLPGAAFLTPPVAPPAPGPGLPPH